MKQTIKFRGKRTDNSEWVYGAYFNMHHNDGREHVHYFIIPDNTDISLGTPIEKIQVEIIPETLGQFTCLTDREGKEIYVGDIVESPTIDPIFGDPIIDMFKKAVIRFNRGAFVIDYGHRMIYLDSLVEHVKVVGNIYDNPELLKE